MVSRSCREDLHTLPARLHALALHLQTAGHMGAAHTSTVTTRVISAPAIAAALRAQRGTQHSLMCDSVGVHVQGYRTPGFAASLIYMMLLEFRILSEQSIADVPTLALKIALELVC